MEIPLHNKSLALCNFKKTELLKTGRYRDGKLVLATDKAIKYNYNK